MIPGLDARLKQDMLKLKGNEDMTEEHINIVCPDNRLFSVWAGGAVVSVS